VTVVLGAVRSYSCPVNVRRGDVFWIRVPSTDGPKPEYAHPHVIIQDDVFNRSRIETVIVCALTSNKKRASEPGNVLLDEGEGSLPKQSVLVVSQVSTVKKADLGERIGQLSQERVDQVIAGMRFQQASFFQDE
jgi:mRNA interferase MazF